MPVKKLRNYLLINYKNKLKLYIFILKERERESEKIFM